MAKNKRAPKAAPARKHPARKHAAPHVAPFHGDRSNPAGLRCGNCGVVFPPGKSQDATLAAHLERGCGP